MPDWHPLMKTGIVEVDDDHRELVRRINELGQAMRRGEGREKVADLLAFLRCCADEHFALEEKLMAEAGYPGADEHRARHEQFRRDLAEQANTFAGAPAERAVALDLHGWVMTWLSNHTLYEDESFADFFRAKGR
ncbi:MAG: hemerythrin family protein [Deltaproteobacteria bacterium]|nr:hemerythrin family protein [Deltaproteobacteria bacterium]